MVVKAVGYELVSRQVSLIVGKIQGNTRKSRLPMPVQTL